MATKRRNFFAEEDLALLQQVRSERPFLAEQGKTMAAWGDLAAQRQNAVSSAASGVNEE
ncbi:hypothetical protein PPTG_13524 [Phytophthora nicotianae INRA-310]|uniref:Transposase n=1 Tax=Phytophthora nicotianae (strain INRA-310) TaxID=761204 RepID=W2Q2L8_PHYN3|nr:hypothetical protein PPTG_13524 [Phytophthora nicotianae INRA-310]ETN07126.1 hypothetical protein PPTG_13524 [Phytophthora nicotianae INRA-310]